jgi:hypothetical protein
VPDPWVQSGSGPEKVGGSEVRKDSACQDDPHLGCAIAVKINR